MMAILDLMTRRRGKLYQPKVPKLVKSGVGEESCRKLFELYCGKPFLSVRPDWLKNPQSGRNLELDGYCEELALAFEFDGEHHTKDGYFGSDLKYTQFKDNLKDSLCVDNGVRLIRIPIQVFYDNKLSEFILEKLRQ